MPVRLFPINVELPDGESITLKVLTSHTIDHVKKLIHDQQDIPGTQQRLFYKSVELDDGDTLLQHSIRSSGSTLTMREPRPTTRMQAPRGARVPQSVYVENRGLDMRKPFTLEEVAHLEAGVRKHAQMKTNLCKAILHDDEFSFQQ